MGTGSPGAWEVGNDTAVTAPDRTTRNATGLFTLKKGKSTASESYVPKNSFWGSLCSQFLPAGLTGEGSPWKGLFCPGDLRTSPRLVVLFLAPSLTFPVPCTDRSARGGRGQMR